MARRAGETPSTRRFDAAAAPARPPGGPRGPRRGTASIQSSPHSWGRRAAGLFLCRSYALRSRARTRGSIPGSARIVAWGSTGPRACAPRGGGCSAPGALCLSSTSASGHTLRTHTGAAWRAPAAGKPASGREGSGLAAGSCRRCPSLPRRPCAERGLAISRLVSSTSLPSLSGNQARAVVVAPGDGSAAGAAVTGVSTAGSAAVIRDRGGASDARSIL